MAEIFFLVVYDWLNCYNFEPVATGKRPILVTPMFPLL
ncbi:hypothetical protein SAMN06264855_14014 [Halorubrum vacuolatum]|uniref:Uncharacterized protein n=1 Tax=Halorubrum vacuolatum TaxID=63740 RepID=A0A238YFQ4_HALVU|nr:hypothetical protein SAMN06264855_14014 [Halorubrum vacuolatum]